MTSAARSRSKAVERKVCRKLGGDRSTSPAQTSAAGTNADCTEVPEYVEVKTRVSKKASGVHDELMELHQRAYRRDRDAIIVYEAEDGPTWLAMWLDTYIDNRDEEHGIFEHDLGDLLSTPLFLVSHRVGNKLASRSLVEETIERAGEEDKPPLAVMHRKGSSKYSTLVPME